jgi:hypothetical protein
MNLTPPPPLTLTHGRRVKDLKKLSVLTFCVAVSLSDIVQKPVSIAAKPLGSVLQLSRWVFSAQDGHFSTSLNDTHVLYSMLVNNCSLPVTYCSILFSALFSYSLLDFIVQYSYYSEIFSPDPGMCSRYFDPHKNNCYLASQ